MVRPETVGKSVVGRIEKSPGRPNLRLVPDQPRDVAEDAVLAEAMRLIADGYTEALKLIPPSHPEYASIQRAARAARESAGLAPLQSARAVEQDSASG